MPPRRARTWLRWVSFATCLLLVVQYLLAGVSLDAVDSWRPDRVLILTAHPDDETMFFAPAIVQLRRQGVHVSGLCLTVGDAEGLGDKRKDELLAAYDTLGVSKASVSAIDDVHLPDGMHARWPQERIIQHVRRHVREYGPFDAVLTFDQGGVTQHVNHVACFEAVRSLTKDGMQAFALRTLPLLSKFGALPGALWRHLRFRLMVAPTANLRSLPAKRISFLSSPVAYWTALQAMAKHRSQLVWFRYLYVIFSGYMYNVQFEAIS